MIKAVIDTNVYISGTFWHGSSREIIHLAKLEKIIVGVSQPLLDELFNVMTNPKKQFKLSYEEANIVVDDYKKFAVLIKPDIKLSIIKEDQADNRVLETAICMNANFIITGDPHLKDIKYYRGILIVPPKEFLNIVK